MLHQTLATNIHAKILIMRQPVPDAQAELLVCPCELCIPKFSLLPFYFMFSISWSLKKHGFCNVVGGGGARGPLLAHGLRDL